MVIRALHESDFPQIREIHERHYKDEFDIGELFKNPINIFVVADENNKVICVGSVRAIVESVLMTDKDRSVRTRRKALYRILDASEFITKRAGFDQLHVFIQDKDWMKHLIKVGFNPTVGQSLVRKL